MMKVIITRPRSQADSFAQALTEAGFEPVFFPVIEILPLEENVALERAIEKLSCYDWVIFTSVNGVKVFFETMSHVTGNIENKARFGAVKTAAIGPKTAKALQQQGIEPDFVPDEYVAEAILPGLGDLRGRWVLLPRAEAARKALPEAILAVGGIAHEIAIYQTIPAIPDTAGLEALKSGVGAVTFTSPSTVENFVQLVRQAGLDPLHLAGNPKIACIGPITQKAAINLGFTDTIIGKDYTTEGLIRLLRHETQEKE